MTAALNLPLLTDDDLGLLFGSDADGARRYRLLHAVLVRGVTQREAAREAGVSERTVRNVLRAYGRSGSIHALRTSASARRRTSPRAAAAEAALVQALAEEPLAGGDRLWRQAQALLGSEGWLSRRTAYRVLAKLRSRTQKRAPAELSGAVRSALPRLQEDPPLTLGGGALAQRLLPDVSDAPARGALLRQALREAIERLRPAPGASSQDRAWWPYLICKGEYEAGCQRSDLQRELVLSASTYSRAKRQAIEKIAAALPPIVAQITVPAAAIALQRLPRTPDFVGRHEEESYYAWRLQTEALAHIWGLPGSGKTVLAAELAARSHRNGRRVLWHTCAAGPDATLAGVVRGLAEALAGGLDDPLLVEARALASAPGEADRLIEALRARLAGEAALVVLDDVHRADAQEAAPLLAMLAGLAARGGLHVLLVGRTRPAAGGWPALPGLRLEEAQLLWAGAGALPEDQWQTLYTLAGGLPQPLRLAAAAYRCAGEHARLSDCVAAVEGWAQDAIWGQLDAAERQALAATQMLAARSRGGEPGVMSAALGVRAAALLAQRGLLADDGGPCALPALRHGAALALREDSELRAAVERLTADAGAPASAAGRELPPGEEPAPPAGMELLARVRRALANSAEYLQAHRDDEASRLVRELAQLNALLPEPRGLRPRPFPGRRGDGRRARYGGRQAAGQR